MKFFNKIFLVLLFVASILYSQIPTKESVTKLYVATFNRAPDSAGLDYWLNSSGLSLEGIAKSFFEQPETQSLYPSNYSEEEFIKAVYQNLFNREPDDGSLKYWAKELRDNLAIDRSVFILAVINGALGDDALILSNKTEVGEYFAEKGLNEVEDAKKVMEGIDASKEKLDSAIAMIVGR